jgi:hypothetical protein
MLRKAVGNANWQNDVKHSWRYEKRGCDDIIYICTAPHEVNLTFNHLTSEQDNFHEVPIKLAGQPSRELVGTKSFQKEKPLGQLLCSR